MAALDRLVELISHGTAAALDRGSFETATRESMDNLFGERYQRRFRSENGQRVAFGPGDDGVWFAGFLHPDSPKSGVYGGASLVWFPTDADEDWPATSLLTFVCGTRGLAPDEQILGRPGHVRHLQAMARYLAAEHGVWCWTKHDPTALTQRIPDMVRQQKPHFASVFNRYGSYIYAATEVPRDSEKARAVVASFLDLYAWERGWEPLAAASQEVTDFKNKLRAYLFPRVSREQVLDLLRERRFVVLQGPPGTGKTRLAHDLFENEFGSRGLEVQFHPAVTYETFVAGISPAVSGESLHFRVKSGWLVQAVQRAKEGEALLCIDEINRADLGRVLGEAIQLFEAKEISEGQSRTITLPQPLEDGKDCLSIPQTLFILGTMNSADRSIAILDLAVRRRFAFVDVWPDIDVVVKTGIRLAVEAFGKLQDIFAQYAPADALSLSPGHAYFLAKSEGELRNRLQFELMPLIQEYLHEGRLGPCETELRAYMDWLQGELVKSG